MREFDYDTKGSWFQQRILNHIIKLEKQGRVPRHESYIITPNDGEFARMGNQSFYDKYGLYYFNKSTHPETKTAAWEEAIRAAKSRIFIKDGFYIGTATINAYPDQGSAEQAVTPSINLEGESVPAGAELISSTPPSSVSSVHYILNSPSVPITLMSFSEQTNPNNGLALSMKNLRLSPIYPTSGSYPAPVVDIETFSLFAMELENIVIGPYSESESGLTGAPPPAGSVGLQIGQTNSQGFVQGGTRKWARNVEVGGCETGIAASVDWVTWERCIVANSNKYAFLHGLLTGGGNPLMNRYIGCHVFDSGGPGFYDNSYDSSAWYSPIVEDFYLESPNTTTGYISTNYVVHPAGNGNYRTILNDASLPDFDPSVTTGFNAELLNASDQGFSGQPTMPSTVAIYNRNASPTFEPGISYRNVNAGYLTVTLGVVLNPTSTAAATAYPGVCKNDPSTSNQYTGTVGALIAPASSSAVTGIYQTVTFQVPPLWYFALVLSNATLVSYTIGLRPFLW
ncbi:MAG: hypothetical protein QW478_13175 [Candidatus Micrarchaeaceae archaeon]